MSEKIDSKRLESMGEKWLEGKIQRMRNLLKIADPDEALYREIMLSLGYPKNKVQFLELSLILPYKELKRLKEKDKIQNALLYRAGFSDDKKGLPEDFDFSLKMEKSVWEFKKIRPANFPDKRIKGISELLADTTSTGIVRYFIDRIEKEIKDIKNPKEAKIVVEKIMDFKGIGKDRKREMFFNIVLPFNLAYLEDKNSNIIQFLKKIFGIHPPLSENSVTKKFIEIINDKQIYKKINFSTKTYFGIHYYIKEKINSLSMK
ncbi:MAG: DUF2851 family protein [bacterium]|nr:DUF2851 family protein [bacterium]MDW8163803.1 DUF2851 family protein [Candidatus Omnitrophota bacterium]